MEQIGLETDIVHEVDRQVSTCVAQQGGPSLSLADLLRRWYMGGEFGFGCWELHLWMKIKSKWLSILQEPPPPPQFLWWVLSGDSQVLYAGSCCCVQTRQHSCPGVWGSFVCFEMKPLREWLQNHSTDRVMGQWRESLARPGDAGDSLCIL